MYYNLVRPIKFNYLTHTIFVPDNQIKKYVSGPPATLSFVVYRTAYSLYTFENISSDKFKWFQTVKAICVVVGLVEYVTIIRFQIKSGSSVQ